MSTFYYCSLFLSVITFISSQAVTFKDCGRGNVKTATVFPCPKSPCVFKLGTTVRIQAVFKADRFSTAVYPVIRGTVGRREFTFSESGIDLCAAKKISPRCPLRRGSTYTYTTDFEIMDYYPTLPAVTVTYKGVSRSGRTVACVQINSTIIRNPINRKRS